jgi:hypothetical protein
MNIIYCSVIIVCKDNLSEVKSTLLSLLTKKNLINGIEAFIIDDSHDQEIEQYVKSFRMKNIHYVRGDGISLYSAMNIGIKKSQGKYLWFLNSGDRKSANFEVDLLSSENADIIYGNTNYFFNNKIVRKQLRPGFKLLETDQLNNFLPCHQSTFFRRQFVIENKVEYDINLKISGDYKFIETLINLGASVLYIPITISEFMLGGISNKYKNLKQVISHAKEIRDTRKLSKLEFLILSLKLCRKLKF